MANDKVKMKPLNVPEGEPATIKEFDLDHAQRILDLSCPIKTWELSDENFVMERGKITPKSKPTVSAK